MRTTLLGLSMPLLLFAAAFAMVVPQASAQAETYEVSGRVTSDEGEPLAGVRVSAYTYPESDGPEVRPYDGYAYRNHDAITDADGRYALELAAGRGYINVYHEEWRIGDGRELVVDGDETDVDFTLRAPPPRTAIIQGTVVDADGSPVAGAQVSLSYGCCYAMAEPMPKTEPAEVDDGSAEGNTTSASPGDAVEPSRIAPAPPYYDDHQSATTDENGEFTFRAYGGDRQITAWARGFAQTTIQVRAVDDETTQVEVELEKVPERDASFTGRVVDADTGLPVAGAQVNVRSLEWGRWADARTGDDGRFRVQTVPGWSEISIHVWAGPEAVALAEDGVARSMPVPGSAQYYPMTFVVDLERGDNEREIELEPKPRPTIALLGYVVDPDAQKGVPGARVHVWNHETGDWGEAVTDSTGSFRIMVREGHHTASAWKEGHLGGSQTFVVRDDAAQRLDIVLPKGTQKWAPCYDEADCGPIMYDMAVKESSASYDGGAPAPRPAASEPPSEQRVERATAPSLAGADESARTGSASYPGEGGGLPEYDPDARNALPAAQPQSGPSEIPGLGVLALVAAAGVLALALRRK